MIENTLLTITVVSNEKCITIKSIVLIFQPFDLQMWVVMEMFLIII